MNIFDFNQRVHLRRDPSQWGYIGVGMFGGNLDSTGTRQFVFWEHEGADIVTAELIEDLMGDDEYRERRSLFIRAMRRPDMRILHLALRYLDWDKGIAWQRVQSLYCEYYADDRCWMLTTDKHLVVCMDAQNPKLTYEDFYLIRLHQEGDPACLCEFCETERRVA